MRRRELLLGAAALASYAQLPSAEAALVGPRRVLLSGKGKTPSVPFLLNFTPTNLSHFRAAQLATTANISDTKILGLGDSTVTGFGGTNGAMNAITGSWVKQVADLVLNSSWQNTFSDHGFGQVVSPGLEFFDSRVTATGSGISIISGINGLGGSSVGPSGSTGVFSFTPTTVFDAVDFGYVVGSTGGIFTVSFDAGLPAATINNVGSTSFATTTVTVLNGMHTINYNWVSGGSAVLEYIICRQVSIKQNLFLNAGFNGATSNIIGGTSQVYSSANVVAVLNPDLALIEGGIINDWNSGVPLATSLANFNTMITKATAGGGNVILLTGTPSEIGVGGDVSQAIQQSYVTQIIDLAYSKGVPCIDTFGLFSTWAIANAKGWMYDNLHPQGLGYAQIAALVAQIINNPSFVSA